MMCLASYLLPFFNNIHKIVDILQLKNVEKKYLNGKYLEIPKVTGMCIGQTEW